MTASLDETALLAAIVANLEEDTPRLIYADCLQENGDDARADFIRTQVELAALRDSRPSECDEWHNTSESPSHWCPLCTWDEKVRPLERRESALLTAHRDKWLVVECPKCAKERFPGYFGNDPLADAFATEILERKCKACDGTGDIGGLTGRLSGGFDRMRHEVDWVRGFPHEVGGCRLADVFEQSQVLEGFPPADLIPWQPTSWALRVFRHHPTLRKMPLVDFEPLHHTGLLRSGYSYVGGDHGPTTPYALPPILIYVAGWDGSEPTDHSHGYSVWPTANEVRERVARAVADVIRSHLKESLK